jgi:YfiH family protein
VRLRDPFRAAGVHLQIDLPGGGALFTTRRGGCSSGPYASLNLGLWTDDRRSDVERNRAAVAAQLSVTLAYGRQVHGRAVTRVTGPRDEAQPPPEADGQATALAGIGLMVLTADCLPIAVIGEGAAAMLHAGWRGLAGRVVAEGVRAVRALGATGPLAAAIGPGAGPCCYEVGDEVRAVFSGHGAAARGGRNLDLPGIARHELERAGVAEIHDCGICTICADKSLFFSHRRDRGVTGRQAGIAWLS